jgi:hypothetical protein
MNKFYLALALIIMLASCNDNNSLDALNSNDSINNEYSLTEAEAIEIANGIPIFNTGVKSAKDMEVKRMEQVKGINKKTSAHVINYKGGGFVVISGTKKSQPIFAFSDKGDFDPNNLIPPVRSWLNDVVDYVDILRELPISESYEAKHVKAAIGDGSQLPTLASLSWSNVPVLEIKRMETIDAVPFMLRTKWGQKEPYNTKLPKTCNNGTSHVYAGCTTIAAAQVMCYHGWPEKYDWDSFEDKYSYNSEHTSVLKLASMIHDIAEEIDVDYGCSSTGAQSKYIEWAMQRMGYDSKANFQSYNEGRMLNDLDNGKPVIIRGCSRENVLGSGVGSCHTFVADGYVRYLLLVTIQPNGPNTFFQVACKQETPHINWGWNGHNDGYYSMFAKFKEGSNGFKFSYQRDNKMIINIEPKF